jgi:molecular chaperone DnaJ
MTRDYYEVLGIPRDADALQVKKAYRNLARQLHPDANTEDPEAEEKFKEVSEAYEVLSNPEKRQLYDQYGHAGMRGAGQQGAGGFGGGFTDFTDIFDAFFGGDLFGMGRQRRNGPERGRDVVVDLELDLKEAAFGLTKEVKVRVLDVCRECGGAGTTDPSSVQTCPECQGAGAIQHVRRTPFGQMVQTAACPRCRGEGRLIGNPCPVCGGRRRAYRERTLSVEVPAGIADGQRIRLNGQGEAGDHGGRHGDLYVNVSVRPHELFERMGDDIVYRQDVTMVQAALGATLTVPTLDGEEEVEFPPGTQPGEVKVLKARGVPRLHRSGRGDEHILVNVMVPRNLNEQQKGLLRDLDECCGMDHYQQKPEGIFHRLKHLITG